MAVWEVVPPLKNVFESLGLTLIPTYLATLEDKGFTMNTFAMMDKDTCVSKLKAVGMREGEIATFIGWRERHKIELREIIDDTIRDVPPLRAVFGRLLLDKKYVKFLEDKGFTMITFAMMDKDTCVSKLKAVGMREGEIATFIGWRERHKDGMREIIDDTIREGKS